MRITTPHRLFVSQVASTLWVIFQRFFTKRNNLFLMTPHDDPERIQFLSSDKGHDRLNLLMPKDKMRHAMDDDGYPPQKRYMKDIVKRANNSEERQTNETSPNTFQKSQRPIIETELALDPKNL
ncbi:hypothetical protein Tco_0925591 [Tanacetum coccineum]|uniref:Uncharacterized protein n=1 Tax=Tanacetum coccineum TaxID=301880 RepID=A0ABQ5D883_9ASTR